MCVCVKANQWGPWPPPSLGSKRAQPAQPDRLQQANRGQGKWSEWAREVRQSQPEWDSGSTKWHSSAGDDHAWKYKSYRFSEWEGSKWSIPTAKYLGGSDYETYRNWHARAMRYGKGWANDPTYSQQKRARPTLTDPEDDMQTAPLMPIGSISKTWNPRSDGQF